MIAKYSNISDSEIEADVINVACKYIIENYGKEIVSNYNINSLRPCIEQNMKYMPLATIFTELAKEIYPNNYTDRYAKSAEISIIQNISWGGMWDFLVGYFAKKHNIQIGTSKSETSVFYSTKHERFENNKVTSVSQEKRIVQLNFINENEVMISIEPSLSAKKAKFIEKNNNKFKYKGFDEDYLFVITKDKLEEIIEFELIMPNKNLRIVYHG